MDFRQLRSFIAVAEELSFSRAAERLNLSQPPLSMQIKALESELGARLFDRTRRKVEITLAGRAFLDHARKAMSELRRAGEVVRLSAQGEAGLIRMGFTGSVPMLTVFPRLMGTFRERYPEVRIKLQHMSTAQQLQALADDDLDVGILRPPYYFQPGPDIVAHKIWRDELMVFLPAGHRLAVEHGPLAMGDLAQELFVGVAPDVGCGMYEHVITLCSRAGFSPRVVQDARELNSVLGLVAAGIGVAILPECYCRIGIAGVTHRKLASPGAESQLLLALRQENAPAHLQRFVDVACELSLALA
jgi:DNA-binding transcriptional LysR family regulator